MKSAKNRARIIDSWSLFTTVSKIVSVLVEIITKAISVQDTRKSVAVESSRMPQANKKGIRKASIDIKSVVNTRYGKSLKF